MLMMLNTNTNIMKKNTQDLLQNSKEACLEANAEKSIFTSHHQNAGKTHNSMTANKSLKNLASSNIWKQ
jgi:hypothetical protein